MPKNVKKCMKLNRNFQRGGEVGIFSGTTHYNNVSITYHNDISLILLFSKITETDDLSLPAVYMSDFLKQSKSSEEQALTLLDCCSGKVEHLNLKHVVRYLIRESVKS